MKLHLSRRRRAKLYARAENFGFVTAILCRVDPASADSKRIFYLSTRGKRFERVAINSSAAAP